MVSLSLPCFIYVLFLLSSSPSRTLVVLDTIVSVPFLVAASRATLLLWCVGYRFVGRLLLSLGQAPTGCAETSAVDVARLLMIRSSKLLEAPLAQ